MVADSHIGQATDAKDAETVIGQLKNDLDGKGYTFAEGDKQVTITYTSSDYESATNKKGANIVATLKLSGNTFTIEKIDYNNK